ncbi:alpha/beta fold hydrolase [Halovenus rubra]|uniref:Alpha/beta fold hydrolase n=2 Tax=Halovenus rubra TaxID=869890 RepID=A0ACC7E3R3_9EURY|nr:alpha/beta hydrolase [Halovenus rubra]
MQRVTSADGTSIAYEQHGDGPPLVLVHGSSGTRHAWDAVIPQLVDDFQLIVPDRRGRGDSGDANEYDLEREVEDLQALLDTIEGEITVFGHSFGGLVTLAATEKTAIDRLILYEPAVLVGEYRDDDLAARMQDCLNEDNRKAAMKLFFQDAGGVPAPEQLPIWPEEVQFELAETVVRENKAVETYELPADPGIAARTLLLTGERGPTHLREAVQTLADRLAKSELVEFEDIGHVGTQSAPGQIAAAVRSFCLEEQPQA